jgi:phosphoglycolate phosphatase-like HAD superfamily hydrolase
MGGVQCTLWLIGVGDSVWDIEAAEEAGVRTVTVTADGASSRAELEEVGVYSVHKHS